MAKSFEDLARGPESQAGAAPARPTPRVGLGGVHGDLTERFDRQVRFAPLGRAGQANPVSYTHLTLPTILRV